MIPFRRRDDPYMLVVGMTGVKMGDRVAFIGCPDGGRLAAIASKVGLSGRAVAVVGDERAAARATRGAAQAGVLVEVEVAPQRPLPLDTGAFDLVVVDDTGAALSAMPAGERAGLVGEALRVLRPGGRLLVIGAAPRTGLGALLPGRRTPASIDPTAILQADGFKSVRTLAERDGLHFVEGLKPRA